MLCVGPEVRGHTSSLLQTHEESCVCPCAHPSLCPRHTLVHVCILPLSDMHREVHMCACTPGAHVQCVVRKPELAALHGLGHCSSLSPRDVPSQTRRADTPIRDTRYSATQPNLPGLQDCQPRQGGAERSGKGFSFQEFIGAQENHNLPSLSLRSGLREPGVRVSVLRAS